MTEMTRPGEFLHKETGDDGSVTYTGLIPAFLAMTLMVVVAAACIATVIYAVKLVVWAIVA